MSAQFEEAVKAASRGGKRSSLRVTTTHNRTHPLQARVAALNVSNDITDRREEDYHLTPQRRRRVYINEMSQAELGDLGFTPAMAERIFKRRPYRTWEEIAERASISESRLDQAVNTTGYDVRIYRL